MNDHLDQLLAELSVPVLPRRDNHGLLAEANFNAQADKLQTHNPSLPSFTVIREQPEHTQALWMRAAGATREEVCARLGWTVSHFRQIEKQVWFRERYEQILRDCGKDRVEALLAGEVVPSLTTLRDLRDDPAQKGSTRVAAANSILDRALGKATVRIETKQVEATPTEATNEVERLRTEAAELARKLSANGVSISPN